MFRGRIQLQLVLSFIWHQVCDHIWGVESIKNGGGRWISLCAEYFRSERVLQRPTSAAIWEFSSDFGKSVSGVFLEWWDERKSLGESRVTQFLRRSRTMAEWQPEEDGLRQILEILRESQSPNTVVQMKVQQVRWSSTRASFLLSARLKSISVLSVMYCLFLLSFSSESRWVESLPGFHEVSIVRSHEVQPGR